MKILVTGGIGNIGLAVSTHLLQKGYAVRIIDHIAPEKVSEEVQSEISGAEYAWVDIRDFSKVRESCQGIDIIVHLAAIPHPIGDRDPEIFAINAGGTFNVYQAAAEEGIKRVISASSINFLGNGFGTGWIDVQYFPIDEAHPGYSTDVYAYSKQLLEHTAAYFWRRFGITSACLRFPFVVNPRQIYTEIMEQFIEATKAAYTEIMAFPEKERFELAKSLKADYLGLRARYLHREINFFELNEILTQKTGGMLMMECDDFWAYLGIEDAVRSIELALSADYEGFQPFYVAATQNSAGVPTRDLTDLFYPEVNTWRKNIQGNETLLDIEKANSILGFEPSS